MTAETVEEDVETELELGLGTEQAHGPRLLGRAHHDRTVEAADRPHLPLTALPEAIRHQADGLSRGKLVITI